MENQIKSEIFTCAEAAGVGLWALVARALQVEGKDAALASMDKIADGKAHVKCEVLLTKRGMAIEGRFCSHGTDSHLFSLTLNGQGDTNAHPSSDSLH
jgi:hypothetical protein